MADQSFGELLVAAMDSRGITRSGLASRTGLHATAIAHFVSGRRKPSVDNLRKIADGVGCSVDELLGRKRTDDEAIRVIGAFRYLCAGDRKCILRVAETMAMNQTHERP